MYYRYYCYSCKKSFEVEGRERDYPPFDNIAPSNVSCPYCGCDNVDEKY